MQQVWGWCGVAVRYRVIFWLIVAREPLARLEGYRSTLIRDLPHLVHLRYFVVEKIHGKLKGYENKLVSWSKSLYYFQYRFSFTFIDDFHSSNIYNLFFCVTCLCTPCTLREHQYMLLFARRSENLVENSFTRMVYKKIFWSIKNYY